MKCGVFLGAICVRLFIMSAASGLTYFEQHFLFSNKFFQCTMGLRPYQSSNDLLVQVCSAGLYGFPIIAHQVNFYQLAISVVPLATTIKVLQYMFAAICFFYTYSNYYSNYLQMKSIISHIKFDYEHMSNKYEFDITEKYTKESKLYTFSILVVFNLYFLATITPCFLSIFSYQFGTLANVNLSLPIPINYVLNLGPIYYSLLIYQATGIYMSISIAIICFSTYLVFINHACCQLSVIRLKIGHPFVKPQKFKQIMDEFDWIVDVIQCHERILRYITLLNTVSKRVYLFEIFFIMLFIILDFLFIFQVSSVRENIIQIIECSSYIACSIFVTFVNFYVGQTLINHSVEARDELCKIPFYNLSIRVQKLLLFMLMRWSKPCVLSIGDIFVSSHEAFVVVSGKRYIIDIKSPYLKEESFILVIAKSILFRIGVPQYTLTLPYLYISVMYYYHHYLTIF
ncbi:uncharacterized protein LOC124953449 isoform X3 [Vespa velutina]|uniref:uncharacterized protein LOC124953449 isoform X3 n=1 Tax=Vespa velutina TaxID=202808 RepID=UPI001FB44B86|nr:uncharacterized protein LOC124953449 isoform X3 [Vespa velutina]